MKQFFVGLLVAASLLGATISPSVLVAAPASAACKDDPILGVTVWYRGLIREEDADGNKYCTVEPDGSNLGKFITMIILNILQAAFAIAAYVTIFYIIKGGFNYMTSAGSSDGMANAKKTITNAVIGLLIVLLSAAIVNTIAGIL